jgi:hypothetical protein
MLVKFYHSIGSNNIIIGTNISLSAGTTNSINLGGVFAMHIHNKNRICTNKW